MAIQIAEVIEIDKAFKPSRSKWGFPLKLGAVKIRFGQASGNPFVEQFAFPLFNFTQVPLIGEHIAVIKGPSSMVSPTGWFPSYYYLGPMAIHGSKHLNPMPGSFEMSQEGEGSGVLQSVASAGPALLRKAQYKPGVHFKEKKEKINIRI